MNILHNTKENLMKKLMILVALFAFTFCSLMAQNDNLADKVTINQTSLNIIKQDIEFPDEAVGYLTDPEGKMIALDCIDPKTAKKKHPKHVLKIYRIDDKKLMWSKDYKPNETQFQFLKQGIMEINNNNITILNKKDGIKIWKKDINYIGIIGDTLIAMSNSGINAFNVENCEKIWLCKMSAKYGVTYCRSIDSDWDYLVSDDLYRINLLTGDMLKLKSKTGVEDPNSSTGAGFLYLRFPGGFWGGFIGGFLSSLAYSFTNYTFYKHKLKVYTNDKQLFMMPLGMISGMHSNVVSKDGLNYYADYNSFMCFDDSLKLVYRTKINNKKINTKKYFIKETRSELIVRDDTAYVVNLGCGFYPTKGKKFYDFPHISTFDIKDGKLLDNQRIAYDSVTIVSTNINDTCINMLLYNRQESYRFADRYMHYTNNDTSKVGHFVSYLNDKMYYVKNEDNSFSAIKSTEKYTPVLTTRGHIVDVSERIPNIIAKKANAFFQIAQLNDMYFYQGGKNDNELWCFHSGQATLVAEDIKQVLQNNDKLEILTTAGKVRIISLGK